MEYNKIQRDFVSRTLKIVEEYEGENEVTLLINCCLGLLVLPKEKHFNKFPNTEITETKPIWGLTYDSITIDCDSGSYKLSDIIRRIRNGVCHFKINTISDGSGNISKLEIKDMGKFKVVLSVSQLREFIKALSNHVLNPSHDSD